MHCYVVSRYTYVVLRFNITVRLETINCLLLKYARLLAFRYKIYSVYAQDRKKNSISSDLPYN